jgi:cell wall-associated NlpC family hydrolase
MGRLSVVVVVGLLVAAVGLGGCVTVLAGSGESGGTAAAGGGAGATAAGGGGPAVPADWEALDQAAAATCSGLPWGVLAAIGRLESDSGRSTLPGVHEGANPAGAEGPMQFEPATFAAYATVGPGGVDPASPYDPVDAVYTAAKMLCTDGGGTATQLATSVWDYDHATTYVETVLVLAHALEVDPTLPSVPAVALTFTARQLGVPYLWGGTGDGGFDCSGLVQVAYRSAGVTLARVAQTQFDEGPPVVGPVIPGDLVFFGGSAVDVSHVGIAIGDGEMIDAPYTGTVVRIDQVPVTPGAPFGTETYVGATRPWM